MTNDIDKFRYLWDGSEPGWVLVRLETETGRGPGDPAYIYNTRKRVALLIDDEELADRVRQKMLMENVLILDTVPPGEYVP
jgi:hypothetical protein